MAKGKITANVSNSVGLKVRNAMSTASGTDTGVRLYRDDVIYGTVLGNFFAFQRIYRRDGSTEEFQNTVYAAVNDPISNILYIEVTNEAEPNPTPPTPTPTQLPIVSMVISGNYEILRLEHNDSGIIIELRPLS